MQVTMEAGGLMPGDNSLSPEAGNYGRLSDKLKIADVERRMETEAVAMREEAVQRAREERARKVQLLYDIPEETRAGTVDDFMFKEGVQDILDKLDYDLIGLRPVKERVREIASLLVVDKMRLKLGLETSVPSLHMGFTGAPGTGKTTVALRMGQILQRMGYCRSGHVVVATRDDLVGQYVGHTAPKTKEMVKKAMGGILLVDEAYYLYNAANDRDYGQESIEILLNVMENNKEDLIVVLAGYKDKMDTFYSYIPGMASRIGNHIEFPNYSADELVEIGKVMCRELEYDLGPDAEPALRAYMAKRMTMPFFANARTVRSRRCTGGRPCCTGRGVGGAACREWAVAAQGLAAQWHSLGSIRRDSAPPLALADPSPRPHPHPSPWQIRNAIDLGRMRAAIRVFNEKTQPGSDGMVETWELQTLAGADFPTMEELEAAEQTQGLSY